MGENIDTGGSIDGFDFSIDPQQEKAKTLEQKSQEFMVQFYRKTMRRVLGEGTLETKSNEGGRYISRKEMEAMKKSSPAMTSTKNPGIVVSSLTTAPAWRSLVRNTR